MKPRPDQIWVQFDRDENGWLVVVRSWIEWFRRPEPPAEINEVR